MSIREIMNKPDSDNAAAVLARRLAGLERRIGDLERWRTMVEGRTMTDQARGGYSWGDGAGEPYYHRDGGALHTAAPWVSSRVRFSEALSSVGHVKAMGLQAALMAASAGGVASLVAWRLELPVLGTGGAVAVVSFALTFSVLLALNRSELHTLVKSQDKAGQRSRSELYIQVNRPDTDGRLRSVQFLLVSGITVDQLSEWAGRVLDGASLAVKAWSGQGSLFSEPQYTALMTELERAGYVIPGRGNVARSLEPRLGPALLRQCAKLGKPE